MAKFVLLLSLLSVIIGWSEAGLLDPLIWSPNAYTRWPNALTRWWTNPLTRWPKVEKDVCGFSLKQSTTRRHELKTEKKNEKKAGEVLLEFKENVRHLKKSAHDIQFFCNDETNRKIMHHANTLEFTLEFDLYLNDGIPYARVNYWDYLDSPQTKYIIKQSGASGPAAYDVSGILGLATAIIPSYLVTRKLEENSAEQYGYWFNNDRDISMHFAGSGTKTIRVSELRLQHEKVTRTSTTVAFHHNDGTIDVFLVPSIDATTTRLNCKNMTDSTSAIVLSEQQRLDRKIFVSSMDGRNNFKFGNIRGAYTPPRRGR